MEKKKGGGMVKDIRSLSYEICVDTDEVKEKLDEIKKIIDSIDFHFKGLKKAVNDLENYNSKFEIKYSLDPCSNKSCQVSNEENKDNIKEYRPYILFNRNINLKKEANKELGFVEFSMTDDISTKDIEDLKLFTENKLS